MWCICTATLGRRDAMLGQVIRLGRGRRGEELLPFHIQIASTAPFPSLMSSRHLLRTALEDCQLRRGTFLKPSALRISITWLYSLAFLFIPSVSTPFSLAVTIDTRLRHTASRTTTDTPLSFPSSTPSLLRNAPSSALRALVANDPTNFYPYKPQRIPLASLFS